jgi:hypothetical protein
MLLVAGPVAVGHVGAAVADAAKPDSLVEKRVSWSATYASHYSYQGLDYSSSRPVLQPQVSARVLGSTLALWGNMDQATHELNEIDLSVQRDWSLHALSGDLGYTHLRYPNRDWDPTHELFVDLNLAAPLDPSVSMHWDVAAGAGRTWALGVEHEFPVKPVALDLATKLYVHGHYYAMSGIPALETSLKGSVGGGGLSIQPTVSRLWTWPNGDYRGIAAVRRSWVIGIIVASP